MRKIIIPSGYTASLGIRETELAIKYVKDFFETALSQKLNLTRVSAPLFVSSESGLNDNLTGVERPVCFEMLDCGVNCEIVHSLAKWKRQMLRRYGFGIGEGLYTDMNAIRRDEITDNTHSVYVDQWDWEKIIPESARDVNILKSIVCDIYSVIKDTEAMIHTQYGHLDSFLSPEITFITTQELEDRWPGLNAKERENAIAKKHGSVFIMQIGGVLNSGHIHDHRAPDYDDWSLNGDILIYYPLLEQALEVSSMGIRVNAESLRFQLTESDCMYRTKYPFHKSLLNSDLPQTIGGGIGQSRLCMLLLGKIHIGEVQSSVWPDDMLELCKQNNIALL